MKIYYCEVCGIRLSNEDLPLGAAPLDDSAEVHYCEEHKPAMKTGRPVRSTPGKIPVGGSNFKMRAITPGDAPQRGGTPIGGASQIRAGKSNAVLHAVKPGSNPELRAVRPGSNPELRVVNPASPAPAGTHPAKRKRATPDGNTVLIWGGAAAVLVIGALFFAMSGNHKTTRRTGSSNSDPQPVLSTQPPAMPPPPGTVQPRKEIALSDIREENAQRRLDELKALEKSGKIDVAELRKLYEEFVSRQSSTRAGAEAAERLKTLPAPAAAAHDATAPSPAEGTWWEGEDAVETNFKPHSWLTTDNFDATLLSGDKWLCHLYAPEWKQPELGNPIFARWKVEVPADATYRFWSREFYHGSAAEFRLRWDDKEWQEISKKHPFVDQVFLGEHRHVVWCDYGDVALTKGSHTLSIEVSKPGISGFDCFYLARILFTPCGSRRPMGVEVQK